MSSASCKSRTSLPSAAPVVGALVCAAVPLLQSVSPLSWVQPRPGVGNASPQAQTEIDSDSGAKMRQLRGARAEEHKGKSSAQVVPAIAGVSGLCLLAGAARRRSRVQCRAAREALVAPEGAEGEDELIMTPETGVVSRSQLLRGSAVATGLAAGATSAQADAEETWTQYDLNTGETLYDIDFDPQDPTHGFVVGARGLFYETKDGGKRWVSRSFSNLGKGGSEIIQYRFQTVSVNGDDVWILGKPALCLHSKNAGKSWKKVPLSRKLPGEPKVIQALGPDQAELATSSGAVYVTENGGKNWRSIVKETVDATLNRVSSSGVNGASYFTGSVKSIKRDPDGNYLAVAQRGNFYLTFSPNTPRWIPHNRISARRIQAMGFRETGNKEPWAGAWMSLNGGYLTNTSDKAFSDIDADSKGIFNFSSIRTGGIGIIDAAFRTPTEGWAVGGSGVMYVSRDGGASWQFDSAGKDLPCNLYNVKFFNSGKVGYMIGSAGILLRKVFEV